jgi:integrase
MSLTLYRRHTKNCTKRYEQNHRVFQPRTAKEIRRDCECPIVVSGTLRRERSRIRHVSTETNRWDKSLATVAQWEAWEGLTDPTPIEAIPTLDQALEQYLTMKGPHGENIGVEALQHYSTMLYKRVRPWCQAHGITDLEAFENFTTVEKCFLSFTNLNPNNNKKGGPADRPLADGMHRAELMRFRAFLRFCMERGWLSQNHATKIKPRRVVTYAKYGLTPEEEAQVWDAISELRLSKGHTPALRALCLVMRYAGLRVSDAVALDHTQLVPRENGDGYAIKIMAQKKTGEWVRVPITDEVADALHTLPFRGECDGKRYWFWGGDGVIDTAVNHWQERITKLFRHAQAKKAFAHHASPHTWRHTFAISMLNAGVDIKMVSRWLGHASINVTESHYAHANAATHAASEQAYDVALGVQRQRAERMRNKLRLISAER